MPKLEKPARTRFFHRLALQCVALILTLAGPVMGAAQEGAVVAAQARGQETSGGLWIAIRVEQLSELGHPALERFAELGPVQGSARLAVRGGALRLEDLQARIHVEGADFAIEGSVADAANWKGLDLGFRLTTASPGWFTGDLNGAARGPVALSGRLTSAGETLNFTELVLTSPASRVTGTLSFTSAQSRPRVTGNLQATTLDLDEFLPPADTKTREDGRLFSDRPLPLHALTDYDTDITLSAGLLRLYGLKLQNTTSVLVGNATATRLTSAGTHAGGRYDGALLLSPTDADTKTALSLTLQGVSWEEASKQFGIEDYLDGGATDASLDVRGRGPSMRAIMATLNGELRMRAGKSRIFNTALDRAGLNLLDRLVDLFTPKEDQIATTDVECAALLLNIRDGVGHAKNGLVVLTSKVVMAGSGDLDLRNEELSLVLDLQARKGRFFSTTSLAGRATLTGPLTAPKVGVSTTGIARIAASLAGAFATGGLSLLGKQAMSITGGDNNKCSAALEGEPTTSTGSAAPAAPGGAVEAVTKEVGKGLKDPLGQ